MSFIVRTNTARSARGSARKILGDRIKIVNNKIYKLYKYVSLDTGLRIVYIAPGIYDLAYETNQRG